MGRGSKTRVLELWMNGSYVGQWRVTPSGEHQLQYSDSWLNNPMVRPISLSLPLVDSASIHKGPIVEAFFDNLLPESDALRKFLGRRLGVRTNSSFDLLYEIGRDCAGALQLLPASWDGTYAGEVAGEPVTEGQIAQGLRNLAASHSFNISQGYDNFRISLAGVQEKTALLHHQGQWMIPIGPTATTHIFKLPIGRVQQIDLTGSVENEWLCLQIFKAFGLPAAEAEICVFEDQKVLVSQRFDRRWSSDGTKLLRIPAEDMCQALGCYSNQKYESEGGPGVKRILDVLLGSLQPMQDRIQFFTSLIVNWLLAAPDAHAKNFTILMTSKNSYRLAPFYDVISAYPFLGSSVHTIHPKKLHMAMAVPAKNRKYKWSLIHLRHWEEAANQVGIPFREAQRVIEHCGKAAEGIAGEIRSVLPPGFPQEISEPILCGMVNASKRLLP